MIFLESILSNFIADRFMYGWSWFDSLSFYDLALDLYWRTKLARVNFVAYIIFSTMFLYLSVRRANTEARPDVSNTEAGLNRLGLGLGGVVGIRRGVADRHDRRWTGQTDYGGRLKFWSFIIRERLYFFNVHIFNIINLCDSYIFG